MDEQKQIDVVVITPERQVLEQQADAVVLPAHDGELGVMRDRAALMCELGVGQLRYTRDGETRRLFIDGGFAQVYDNHVTLLTARALLADEITAEVLDEAREAVDAQQGYDDAACVARERAQRRLSVLSGLSRAS